MMSDPLAAPPPPPRCIYLIRHGEKPADPGADGSSTAASDGPDGAAGVDVEGTPNQHSLTPRGWQRTGALAVLFTHPSNAPGAVALSIPNRLFAPSYSGTADTHEHRPYQTLLALSALIDLTIESPCEVGQEGQLAEAVLALPVDTVLICWEHQNIRPILDAIGKAVPITPTSADTPVPTRWPGQRFDLIWQLVRSDTTPAAYEFTPVPQAVLAGDENASIPT